MTTAEWERPDGRTELQQAEAHIWRILLDGNDSPALFNSLSDDERARAGRFYAPAHAARYTVAHGILRRILSRYTGTRPDLLQFETGEHGKPYLSRVDTGSEPAIYFNLSHSADIALVAVSATGEIGVDVEFWREDVRHLEIADRFFSVAERVALRALESNAQQLMQGFFSGWSRKEAYIKASGLGIARGLEHFDVSLEPAAPATILQDRHDAHAAARWAMVNIDVGLGYSAAIVATAPLQVVRQYDAATI